MKLLVFRYDCGWEYPIRVLPGQTVAELKSRFGRRIQRIHHRTCDDCPTRRNRTKRNQSTPTDPTT